MTEKEVLIFIKLQLEVVTTFEPFKFFAVTKTKGEFLLFKNKKNIWVFRNSS